MRKRLVLLCFFSLWFAAGAQVEAATNMSIWFDGTGVNSATCAGADLDYHFLLTATTDDGGGCDYIAVITFDGYGNPLDVDFLCYGVGAIYIQTEYTDMGAIADPTARPIWVAIYDIPNPGGRPENTVAAAQWVLSQGRQAFGGAASIDPAAINTACAVLPLGNYDPTTAIDGVAGAPAITPWGFVASAGLVTLTALLRLRRRIYC